MSLYFINNYYKEKALKDAKKEHTSEHSVEDAMFLLIEGVNREDLSNLCELIKQHYKNEETSIELSTEECYKLTQGMSINDKVEFNEEVENIIYNLAYKCIESGKTLGNKTIMDGKINTSDWIGHSLFEGKLAGQLAKKSGLDVARATKLGILHDYGRKTIQNFDHVIRGYEALSDKGWDAEAIGCLTHSFLAGGRCASNESAQEGFYVDDEGTPCWKEGAPKDDLTVFLENYNYTKYDIILNIADLMATSYGIVSPSERIADIATRRKKFDPANRAYFLAELTNKLTEMLEDIGGEVKQDMKNKVKASKGVTLEEITQKFERASELFFDEYQKTFGNTDLKQNAEEVLPKDIVKADMEKKITETDTKNVEKFFEGRLKEQGER